MHNSCGLVVNINSFLLAPKIFCKFLLNQLSELNRLSVKQQSRCEHGQIHNEASQNLKGYPKKATFNMIVPELKKDAVEGSEDVSDDDDEQTVLLQSFVIRLVEGDGLAEGFAQEQVAGHDDRGAGDHHVSNEVVDLFIQILLILSVLYCSVSDVVIVDAHECYNEVSDNCKIDDNSWQIADQAHLFNLFIHGS